MNISYTKQGDYLLSNLILNNKEQFNIGKYGLLKLDHLKSNLCASKRNNIKSIIEQIVLSKFILIIELF